MLEDKFINVGGVRTRYWQEGTNQNSVVLLLHGAACSILEWKENIESLSLNHRVFAVDLVGSGWTDKPTTSSSQPYTIPSLTKFVLDFMDSVGITTTPVHFMGNSSGGRLALECARVAPERVASIVLVAPAGIDCDGSLLEFRLSTVPVLGEICTFPNSMGTRMLWNKAFANPSKFVTEDFVKEKVRLSSLPGAQLAFLKFMRNFLTVHGFRRELVDQLHAAMPMMNFPILVILGKSDQFISVRHAEVLRNKLPQVDVQLWDNCGHAPQIEKAEEFNATVSRFLEGIIRTRHETILEGSG